MTELQSWQETFEACKAGGLKLPADHAIDGGGMYRHDRDDPELGIDDAAALALCRWTAVAWLDFPSICEPMASDKWFIDGEIVGDTIDAALQAACRAKAHVDPIDTSAKHVNSRDENRHDEPGDFTQGNY